VEELVYRFKEINKLPDNGNSKKLEMEFLKQDAQELLNDLEHQVYLRLSTEVEARNTQTRMKLTPKERRLSLASDTEDVARIQQIIQDLDKGTTKHLGLPSKAK
jgi:hypothetical protein